MHPDKSRRRISPDDALTLWQEYRQSGDQRLRDRLIMTYAPLVKYIVYKKIRELPARCEVEDFISCGLEALINSIDRYDPQKGATLEQFAWTRIHGAVLDELRRQDWAPRSLRRWERDIAKARESFNVLHGRRPTREELAEALSTTAEELRTPRAGHRRLRRHLAEHARGQRRGDHRRAHRHARVARTAASSPSRRRPRRRPRSASASAFAKLPDREREVAVLLYVKNLTLREIGDVLGVSESRVCQIHSGLKKKLKEELATHSLLFVEAA